MGIHKPGNLIFALVFVWGAVFIGKMLFTSTPLSKVPGAKTFGANL